MMGLAFFDHNVNIHEKVQMVRNMQEREGSDDAPHCLHEQKTLSNFVTKNTNAFFTILGLSQLFLQTLPATEKESEEFTFAEKIV